MGKVFKKIAGAFSKGVGAITGSNAAKKAAEDQARQMELQRAQEAQQAAQGAQENAMRAAAQQKSIESNLERDSVLKRAEDERKRAQEAGGGEGTVDVDLSGESADTDSDGRRINTREKFMSGKTKKEGLRL